MPNQHRWAFCFYPMKTKTITALEVEYHEIDKSIIEFLRSLEIEYKPGAIQVSEYSCVACEEMNNNSQHQFSVESKQPYWYHIDEILAGKFMWNTSSILNWMCCAGLIEKGEYLVTVCW